MLWLLVLLAATSAAPDDPLAEVVSSAEVRAALRDAEARRERFVDEWIRIAQIPAPSGAEGERAAHLEERFRAAGFSGVARDAAGNVLALLAGRDPDLKQVAFVAHLDTVAPADADHTVRRRPEGRLEGPGVRDDSSGLAGLLAAAELMKRHRLVPPADTWFVASVREEIGLHGAQRFIRDHGDSLGALVAVDGHLGQVSYGATGILWLKVRFTAGGAHTLGSHAAPSAVLAAARAIERVHAIPLRRSPEPMESWLNIGMIGGGAVPNAQARDVWFTVDLRSNDGESFGSLERQVREIAQATAREVGVGVEIETMHRMAGASIPGFERSPLVSAARRVLEHLAWTPVHVTPRGTADHNVAIARGIPGIAIGVTTGDGAHTPDEYADIEPFVTGVRQIVLLAMLPLTDARRAGGSY